MMKVNKKVAMVMFLLILGLIAVVLMIIFFNENSRLAKKSGQSVVDDQHSSNTNNSSLEGNKMTASKILVVYFSKDGENYGVGKVEVGNTQLLAKEIVSQTKADEFKIESVEH